ncbi:MAG: ribonuclease HI, partial [Nitrospinae bacterium]|nr:ribonuclease HI [Nitrospinota bacterium]
MKKIAIYTDGACRGNPGPGGYAAILKDGEKVKKIKGADKGTTNNRM